MALEIRPVRLEEHDEAGRVTALAYDEFAPGSDSPNPDYRARLADVVTRTRHALVLAAVEDGRVLGTVTLETGDRVPGSRDRPSVADDEVHVRMLGVHPEAQRRGIGRALMEAVIEVARSMGRRRITLDTTESMVAAQKLYESMGFARGDDLVYDDGFRLRWYELSL